MLTNKPVLPNFLKTIIVASMATASVSAFAGNDEGTEEKIGDLKDMKAKSSQLKADELTSSLDDSSAVEGALSAESKKELEMKAKEIMEEEAKEAKPE